MNGWLFLKNQGTDDYLLTLQTVDCRYADISYMAGIEDAITFLKKMDLIKNTIE